MTSLSEEAPLDAQATAQRWEATDWTHIERRVNKLQSRITKATQDGKLHLVRRLQHVLKNSFHAKLLAVQRVTTNKGKRTPGIDGAIWSTPASKYKAALSLSPRGYHARPLRRVFIEKKGKAKKRPLGIPTMHDRAMQALFALTVDPVAEATGDRTSFGFRRRRSCNDAGQYLFLRLSQKEDAQWILEGDIKGCFDHINHEWLLTHIPMDKRILKQFLKAGYIYKRKLFPTDDGTPQGGVISPILANMTLDGIEEVLKRRFWMYTSGRSSRPANPKKIFYVRYADDFVVTADTPEAAAEAREVIRDFLRTRGLELSEEKTLITHIDTGFDFLGWTFRKYRSKLLIKPSSDSYRKITQKIRDTIRKYRGESQDALIGALNPIIRGWCNYHRSVVAGKTFEKLDTEIFKALWNWAKHRHPNKSHGWKKDRYWNRHGSRDWIFGSKQNTLLLATDTRISRHRLVNLSKNPYLPADRLYYDMRSLATRRRQQSPPTEQVGCR